KRMAVGGSVKAATPGGEQSPVIYVWDLDADKEVRRLQGHTKPVNSLAFANDGTRILSGSDDASMRLWDAQTGKEVRRFNGHSAAISSVAISPDGRLALSGSGDYQKTGKGRDEHPVVKDGKLVMIDCTVRLWDLQTGKELHRFEGHTEE